MVDAIMTDIHRLEYTEAELCEELKCTFQTLRSYLCGYKFTNVEKIKVWYYKNSDKKTRKRKSLTYDYVLSQKELNELHKLRDRNIKWTLRKNLLNTF